MVRKYRENKLAPALTLVEMLVALVIIVIVFAAIVPQLRAIQNSWASKKGKLDVMENGRALMDHITLNLMAAKTITAVSGSTETNGYIEFQDNDSNTFRYDIAANNYVEFGPVGDLSDLAGQVSQLQFTCYDACDLDTPITEPNLIRCVQVQATVTNPSPLGQDRTFTAKAYLRTNFNEEQLGYTPYVVTGSEFEFDTSRCLRPALWQIDASHYLCVYQGPSDDGWAVVLTVDTNSWTITKETPFEYNTTNGRTPALWQIDSTHYLCAYEGDGADGWAVVLTVNTGNWTISKETPFEFENENGRVAALSQIDATHYLCAYEAPSTEGYAVVLTVNTGTWGISIEDEEESFDEDKGTVPALAKIDDIHYLCAYQGGGDDGWAVVLEVDPDEWEIGSKTRFEFDTLKGKYPALSQIDSDHYLCAYQGDSDDGWAVVLTLNPSNHVIRKETPFEFDVQKGITPVLARVDDTHYLCAYQGDADDGWAVVLVVDAGFNISKYSSVEFDPEKAKEPALAKIDNGHYLCVYRGGGDDGWAVILGLSPPILP